LLERDSEGRTRIGHVDAPKLDGTMRTAIIADPVALRMINIDYVRRKATVSAIPAANAGRVFPSDKPFTTENPERRDLGENMMAGFKVHGYGWTKKATGTGSGGVGMGGIGDSVSRFSADALPVTYEQWWSPELRIYLLQIRRDANGNEQVIRHEKIQLKEPGPGTFSIPEGFEVTTAKPGP
jgi:hypothetical protein